MSTAISHRGRVAALTRSRSADDPDLLDARRDLKAANIQTWLQKQLSEAPPLNTHQRENLARLLAPSPESKAGEAA